MQILMLVPHEGVRGPIRRIVGLLADELRGLGCEVSTADWGRHADDEGLAAKLTDRWRDVLRLRGVITRTRPDCVLVQTSHDWRSVVRDLALVGMLRTQPAPLVLQMHGTLADRLVAPGNALLKRATSLLLTAVEGVLLLSTEERDAFEAFQPSARFEVVSNPFAAPPRASYGDERVRPLGRGDTAVLLFAGRLLPEKGVLDLVEALALLGDHRRARLAVAGAGPAEERVAAAARARGLSDRVELVGHLATAALLQAYADADVFVFPTYHAEGFPTVIAEAMSAGLPIVTTRTRGIPDHLEDGVNAVFVPPRDPAALAATIDALLADLPLRERMARANRAAVKRFAPDRVAREYLTALERVLV
jgi:glycosyltransferase involved in cell wall biosynthesis